MATPQPLISELIVDRPMCLACIASRTRMKSAAVETVLKVLGRSLVIRRHPAETCTECGTGSTVYLLEIR